MNEQRDARLLIAEDEANLRLVLQKELQRLGYRVQAANDGEAALRKLEESNVDVLLCDINMPHMDGMELLRRLHERPNPPEVIMLTGQGTIETAVEAMKLGAYDYLTKPYSINELDVRVRQACEKRNLRVTTKGCAPRSNGRRRCPKSSAGRARWPKQFVWWNESRLPKLPF